jgi:hypothetical protein
METNIIYKISKEQCAAIVDGLVCDGCGGPLEPMETVDNAGDPTFWPVCNSCSKYHWGTKKEIHEIAKRLVDDFHYIAYSHMENPACRTNDAEWYKQYYRTAQIAGACSIVRNVLQIKSEIESVLLEAKTILQK